MALKELLKPVAPITKATEDKVNKFISQGGTLASKFEEEDGDHRLTLRMPKWLLEKVDIKRKERVGSISRNLWILELIEKATK